MTYLGGWGTYYIVSGTATPNTASGDAFGNFKVYYEYEPTNLRYRISVECYLRRYPMTGNALPEISGNIRPSVNGTTGTQVSYSKSITSGSSLSSERISTQTFYAYVNQSDGTSSVSLSGRFYGNMSGYTATRTCSHTWSLPTVPISSTITNDTSSSSRKNFGTSVTFTITPPTGSSNMTHTLTYEVSGNTYTIATDDSRTTIPYTFPTTLIIQYPDNGIPSINVYCKNSNNITSSTEVFLQVPDTDTYRPTISISLTDTMSNKPQALNGLWINNKSKLQGSISATAYGQQDGASIKSYLSSLSGFSTEYYTALFETVVLTVSGNRTLTYSATDSRGLTKTATQSVNVIDYFTPTIVNAKVERCDSNGNLDESGSFGKATISYKVAPIENNNVNLNTKTIKVKLETSGTEYTIPTTANVYDETVSAWFDFNLTETTTGTFYFTLTDIFNDNIPPTPFELGVAYKTVSKRAGGKGIAFGKVATQDGFDCNMDAVFRGTLTGNLTGNATGLENRSFISQNSSTYLQGNDDDIETKKALQNWNGAYNSSNDSNLKYCNGGEIFGGETGTSGIWTYMKFNNGIAVCFGRKQVSTTINTQWGNLYTSANITIDDYPTNLFNVAPTVTYTNTTGDSWSAFICAGASNLASKTSPGNIFLARGNNSSSNQDYIINIIAIGTWR